MYLVYLLDERLRRRLPLSAEFFTLPFPWSPLLLVFPLLDLTGLRPRVLEVRFFSLSLSLSLRGAGERERLLRLLKNNGDYSKIMKKTIIINTDN